jgi:PAS domain S-box-containing protein
VNIHQHLEFLLREGPVVVFCCDPYTWTPNYISENVEAVSGFPVQEFFTRSQLWLEITHPDDRERVLRDFEGLKSQPNETRVVLEYRIWHASGKVVHVHIEANLIRDAAGNPLEVMGFLFDLTQNIQQKKDLERQKELLEAANESLEQFVYVASHDLREPLVGVAGYASLLQRRYADKLDAIGAGYIEKIMAACKQMETKIDDLLELSRAGRGTPSGTFPLGAAVEQAKRSLVGPIAQTQAEVVYKDLPLVRGDRGQIAQVFQNLFSNSMKYHKKEATPVIQVAAQTFEEDPSRWLISVKDNGLGFEMSQAERIFGVFQRLYSFEEYPGTGIGLAIVRKIIDRHDGQVWAEARPNCGSTFFFTLAKTDT